MKTSELLKVKNATELHKICMDSGFYVNFGSGTKARQLKLVCSDKVVNHLASLSSGSTDNGARRKYHFELDNEMIDLVFSCGTYVGTKGEVRIQSVEYLK